MRHVVRNGLNIARSALWSRPFSGTPVLDTKRWRVQQGLCANRNAESAITDGPDYTFLDGRPTPLLHKQKLRMLRQQEYASQIVRLSSELDFAKERHQQMQKDEEDVRQRIISNRLKPKGNALKTK